MLTIDASQVNQAVRDLVRKLEPDRSRLQRVIMQTARSEIQLPIARQVATDTGLTLAQARKRVRVKRLRRGELGAMIYSTGSRGVVHAGRIKGIQDPSGGLIVGGKRLRMAFLLRPDKYRGEHSRVYRRKRDGGIESVNVTRTLAPSYERALELKGVRERASRRLAAKLLAELTRGA